MRKRSNAELGRLALEVRGDFGLLDTQPFDPFAWSRECGIPFISLRDFTADEAAMHHFLHERSHVWSAALIKDGRSHLVIYNPQHSTARTRSDLTHEIAHFEADHEPSPSWTDEAGGCGGTSKVHEQEAVELAASILIPPVKAKEAAIFGRTPQWLAGRYQVSIEMATWRMNTSGGYVIARRAAARRAR